jgi:hypothetical protein
MLPGDTEGDRALWRAATALWVGAAALNLFLQANYTGPALEMTPAFSSLASQVGALAGPRWGLDADGESPFSKSVLPEMLCLARGVLHPLALPGLLPWSHPVQLTAEGHATLPACPTACPLAFSSTVTLLETAKLWAGRAVVTHRRLFSGRHPSPGLWAEAQAVFLPLIKVTTAFPQPATPCAASRKTRGLGLFLCLVLRLE